MVMKIDGSKASQNFFVIKPLLTMVSSFHVKFSLVHVVNHFPLIYRIQAFKPLAKASRRSLSWILDSNRY